MSVLVATSLVPHGCDLAGIVGIEGTLHGWGSPARTLLRRCAGYLGRQSYGNERGSSNEENRRDAMLDMIADGGEI
jgi:hypothetical protein